MARKKTAAVASAAPGPVRICFERIIPDEIDPERPVRRALRDVMAAGSGRTLNPDGMAHIARMAVAISKKWQPGEVVKCRFLDGSATLRRNVEAVAHQWEQHCSIRFRFVASGPASIRISFTADPGSWSAVGRDALNAAYFPLHQPTMNFGWLRDNSPADEYSRVVLHEFGHALGCVHEHQSPTFTRVWNTQAVMRAFQGPPNYWTPAEIRHNVLGRYSAAGISATQFDPKSIMLYSFDGALFSDGLGPTNSNTRPSPTDIRMIRAMYP